MGNFVFSFGFLDGMYDILVDEAKKSCYDILKRMNGMEGAKPWSI